MRFSVVIATKDRAGYLERALASLNDQVGAPSFEVIVVDNGSTDATAQIVDRARESMRCDVQYRFEAAPNRAAARNRGVELAQGHLIVFVDDDVWLPPGFLEAHERAHTTRNLVVNGPIVNVPSYEDRRKPTPANFSRAFLCTCNVSLERRAFLEVNGFDEEFRLYGWEDTDLGLRLRERGARAKFAWTAFLYHIKPPHEATLDQALQKTVEKAHMAVRFVRKTPSRRARFATGAYALNLLRARLVAPAWMLPLYAGVAVQERVPPLIRSIARTRLLDGIYAQELARELGQ
ncbi:MAG: glycosyltransferase family 2 protein [Candidatus Eremiobacteraeota bacterium]|nr:glycosyltransferase family 2 protein [Candidatus Eremiobacteraeota bacterium]